MEYQDFTIDVRSLGRGRFEATAVEAPIRESPRVVFSTPIPRRTLHKLLKAPASSTRELGQALYRALFQGKLGDLFIRCRAGLPRDGRTGLRIRLRFSLDEEDAAYLAALPWELLCNPAGELLAKDFSTPIVREIQSPRPQGVLTIEAPLRILVVGEAPSDMPDLKMKLEMERLETALGELRKEGRVELIPMDNATVDTLGDFLWKEPVHVLHFIGHGGYHVPSGTGALFFVKADGTKFQVDGEMFADYLKRAPDLRLVVLNSCWSARYAGHAGARLDCGVASTLVERTGVLAVVANQYSISHDAAIDFSGTLYRLIAAGQWVETALTEARMRIFHRSHEWATPVLFLGARDGRLFNVETKKTQAAAVPARSEAQPVCLGIRSIDGWGKDMKDVNDHFLDLTPFFYDNRYVRRQEDWQEEIFPQVRDFLLKHADERRPLLLDLAAHASIAFAAGWLLEAKSGLDVRVCQRTQGEGKLDWYPKDRPVPEGPLWLDEQDIEVSPKGQDVAVALAVSQPTVPEEALEYIQNRGLPVGRILQAVIAPEPGGRSVEGGAHSLRLAQSLLPRIRRRRPHERGGRVHLFCASPNALMFYLGQLSRSFGRIVLYEYPFGEEDSWADYRPSIELPPPR
jgi:hypothetical protein